MAQTTTTPTPAAPPAVAARTVRASAYVWVVLFASSLVQTTASFGNQAISPLAPFLLPDLGLNKSQLGLVLTAFYVGGIAIMTAAGWASDRLGVRRMFLVGLLGCGAPLLLASQAPGLAVLMAAMLLAGLGNGVALPSTTRAIVDWFPARHRGLAMGRWPRSAGSRPASACWPGCFTASRARRTASSGAARRRATASGAWCATAT
jgi:sugar phosphate permease